MPLIHRRKRRAEPEREDEESSPESQTQRRRTQADPEDEEAFEDEDNNEQTQDSSLEQMVKKLVRLALACEYTRRPIRRADISEKVLGPNAGRQFKKVFDGSQQQLRHIFGMEMVELPAREKVTVQQRRAAAAAADGRAGKQGTGQWVLRSVLPSEYNDPEVRHVSAVPTQTEESIYTGIYTVLVCLINLSGGQLPDAKLERYLRRLLLEDRTPLPGESAKTEKLLKRMEKDGYVVKVRENTGGGNEDDIYWIVGPRGKVEVGVDGTRGLVKAVYNAPEGEETVDLERRLVRSLGIGEKPVEEVQPTQQRRRGRPRRDEQEQQDEERSDDDDSD